MASREKRPLAPSKSKQKANNDSSSLPAADNNRSCTKKSKLLPNPRTQLARDIFEAVATGSQLPAKLEASLPRKRVLQTALKRKQKAKKTLIKVKQKVPIKALKRIADAKKILNRKKRAVKSLARQLTIDSTIESSPESEETKSKYKTAKKSKVPAKISEEAESETLDKSSPKLGKKIIESSPKSAKGSKAAAASVVQKRNDSKERDLKVKRSLSKEPEDLKQVKTESVSDNSYELTIEEVIASSMLVGPEVVKGQQSALEGELKGKRILKNITIKRSLRNGKLRQSLSIIETESDQKKISAMSETNVDNGVETKSASLSDSVDVKDSSVVIKSESSDNSSTTNHVSDTPDIERNNNGCEGGESERIEEIGPTLRSKTKARNSDSNSDVKSVDSDVKVEDNSRSAVKSESDAIKKDRLLSKFVETRSSTGAINNAPKSRRSSLNIDMRRTSLYTSGSDKITVDGGSKSQIDQMIDKIKLTIAKTIESKIYKPDNKGLILGKSFEVPKIEEIVAPLSNDTTTPKLEDDAEEEKPNVSKSRELNTGIGPSTAKKELKVEDAENSVPRVADTAKEIEKLVMGDIEPAESQPQQEKSEQPVDDNDASVGVELEDALKKDEQINDKGSQQSASTENLDDSGKDSTVKQPDDVKKSASTCSIRKSTRATVAKSSNVSEVKKSMSTQDICNELEKLDEEEIKTPEKEKTSILNIKPEENGAKATEEETSSEASSIKCDTDEIENKDLTEDSTDVDKVDDVITPEICTENEKIECEESNGSEKNEETLESLSMEVERLVEADDNEKTTEKISEITENEGSSDVEMRLMIDEEVADLAHEESDSKSSELQINNNKDGCDEKNCTESPEDVQKNEPEVEFSNVTQENKETGIISPKLIVSDDKPKDTVKTKLTEIDEVEEQKENRRVLRTRADKQKKVETIKSGSTSIPLAQDKSEVKVIKIDDTIISEVPLITSQNNTESDNTGNQSQASTNETTDLMEATATIKVEVEEQHEPQIRTRRGREAKKPPQIQVVKGKRGPKKQETKKIESQQQNKEETLLDNEVAKINENDRSSGYLKTDESLRGFSANAGSNAEQQKLEVQETKGRSKSENDVRSTKLTNDILKSESADLTSLVETETTDTTEVTEPIEVECKGTITKDSDEASTSGESSSSVEKILETPEDRAKKEDILRQLGLESWQRVKERKAKKEQQYTGTLKTIIRLQKEKEGKKRSRSPLKMVLKQQGRMDGEESFDFYTIQKEFGSSGLVDSSSGANRKLPTNPRHSCDEDNDDAPLKDRQSLVIPEKSSSFSIHPGRLCADNCCYCHGKFGSLDTPMHLAQMKSDERRKKILENEVHLTKDSCLCDACYRHVDRKANMSPTNMQLKPQRQHRQSIMGCMARNCSESARHHVKRRWLLKIKPNLRNQVDINWESTQHNLMTFCGTHYTKIERFLTCTLCKRRLTRNYTYPLGLTATSTEELNKRLRQQGIPAAMVVNTFVCRLCRYFTKLYLKNNDFENMSDNNKDFHKKYRKKLLYYHDIDVPDSEEETDSSNQISKNKEKGRPPGTVGRKPKCGSSGIKLPISKSPDNMESHSTSTSEKSSPEPPKTESGEPEAHIKGEAGSSADGRFLGIEGAIEKLKKRKALDTGHGPRNLLSSVAEVTSNGDNSARDVVEILAMDKEVTLTRLPKRPRLTNNNTTNDITPVVQRLGANPSISVRTLFPGEEEMSLHANVEFGNVREVTPQGWEKCATMIQYDRDTKMLWQELQRPYGNQSSFLRHLILLEKYYRSGDLILAPNASRNAINYSTSVQNRLISYEGPEKPEELIIEAPTIMEHSSSRRLSGGYILENREHRSSSISASATSSSTSSFANVAAQLSKLDASSRPMKLTPGLSIIKKPPPNLQRLNLGSGSGGLGVGGVNGSAKRKESLPVQKGGANASLTTPGGKVFQLTEPDFKRLQNLKRQKQMNERQTTSSPNSGSGSSSSPPSNYKNATSLAAQYQKAQQLAAQSQFQKHLRMQQEMLNQRSRGDFEPLICDIRSLANENTPTQNLINNLNLPKSIQVTTKAPTATSTPIPILPKIPKSLTVIPQTVARTQDK
ncbi:PREDICTED: uncharacterized protein LOC105368027 isoform X2 [Ceratosolen solmsi marchali]|uniref:Uncharacterized protein LOC105368027 isoform X2 n=1 Tax=Ceratosolen solmsi marchali TaxID=326594 RepID=A0AAJ6YVN4_9HYME|nr:PREDICTED: uncharacterized protein LOC105368027 isoform X2 [Ceratosolen solmsi marchali]